MNILDMRTVMFSYILSSAICAAVMAFLWLQNRRRMPELAFWLADFGMQFLGVLLITLRGLLPDLVSMALGSTLMVAGSLLLLIGLERYTGRTGWHWFNILYLVAFVIVHVFFVAVQPGQLGRNINISLGIFIMTAQCAWLLLRRVEPVMRPETRAAGLVFLVFSLLSFARIFLDLAAPPANDFFRSGLYDILVVLSYQMLYIILAFSLSLMINHRLVKTLESDIVEMNRAEEALKVSQEKFLVAFHNIPDIIIITSLVDGKILEANESFYRISGYDKADTLGRTTIEMDLWANIDQRNQLVAALQKQGRVLDFETEFRKKNNQLFSGSISSELIQLQDQTFVLNVIHDLTGSKQAQDDLHTSEERYRLLFNNMTEGFALHDLLLDADGQPCDYRFLEVNPAFEDLTGLKREDILGRGHLEVMPDEDPFWFETYKKVALTGQSIRLEHYSPPLQKHYGVYAYCPIPNQFAFIFSDITERKQAEEKIQLLNATLEQRVEDRTRDLNVAQEQLVRQEKLAVLGQVAGSIGHELRNPLGVISNAIYYLKMVQPDADAKVREYLDMIEDQTRISSKIIGDLLDFARLKAANKQQTSVPDLLHQTLARYPAPPSVQVLLELPTDLPPILVDPQQIIQILGNLTQNACQAMLDGGALTISSSVNSDQSSVSSDQPTVITGNRQPTTGNWILITVSDTGPGIPPGNMAKLFEPLFSTKPNGIGLGLPLSRKLAEANGGRIEVQSELGKGSAFSLWLPIQAK
jgi:PAS domain S-box-containing protein